MRRLTPLLCWLGGLTGAVAVLAAAGRGALAGPDLLHPSSWTAWAAGRDPVDVAVAILRIGLLIVATYLLTVTVLGVVARLVVVPRLLGAIDIAGGRVVRRVLTGAFGVGLATSPLTAATAMTSTGPPPTAVMHLLDDTPATTSTTTTIAPAPTVAVAVPPSSPGRPAYREHLVRPGQSFWHIAAEHLEAELRRPPSEREIAAYWRDLIAANRDRLLAPSQPDLIYPGQRFRLP